MGQIDWDPFLLNDSTVYWKNMDSFAVNNKITMWLTEAIDNPWKIWSQVAHQLGYWKLENNAKILSIDGYIPKISEKQNQTENGDKPKPGILYYVGYVSMAVLFCLLGLVILWIRFRAQNMPVKLTEDDVKAFLYGMNDDISSPDCNENATQCALKLPYNKSFEISRENLEIRQEIPLGTGQFGVVYKAAIQQGEENSEVALKIAKDDCPLSALKGFMSEIKILIYLGRHENIVSMRGAYTDELLNGIVYIATELCDLGSLDNYLRYSRPNKGNGQYIEAHLINTVGRANRTEVGTTSPKITYYDLFRWSTEIATGMHYLARKHIVHGDLATRNVLLTSDKTAKITDFGLSRRLYDYAEYVKKEQGEILPWRWMAVESLNTLNFSTKTDAWSYGITLWEMFSMGEIPYPGVSWNSEFVESIINGTRLKCPKYATSDMYQIMAHCWRLDPNERPTFSELEEALQNMLDIIGDCSEKENLLV